MFIGAVAFWAFAEKMRLGVDNRVSRALGVFAPFAFFVYLLHEPTLSFFMHASTRMLHPS
jgi:hypothetical protein